jgi:acetyl esterase/lipase
MRPHFAIGMTFGSLLAGLPAQVRAAIGDVDEDITYATAAKDPQRNRLDLYRPKGVDKPPLVMFVHGGTWVAGSKERHRWIGEALAAHGYAAAVINYRLSPFARHPDQVSDCAAAFAWLYQHADDAHFDRDRMFAMSHSAGAHLASLMALDGHYLADLGVPADALKGVVALSGVYDVRPHVQVLDAVFGKDPKVRADASPILHATAAAPPFLLLAAETDIPGLEYGTRILREQLTMLGVPVTAGLLTHENHASYLFRFGGRDDVLGGPVFDFLAQRCAEAQRPLPRSPRAAVATKVQSGLAYGTGAAQHFDLYVPLSPHPAPVLVFAHGGNLDGGSRGDAAAFAAALAAEGVAVAAIDYTLLPQRVHPGAFADLAAAFAHLRTHAADLGIDRQAMWLGGLQGGALLAIAVAQAPHWLADAGVPAAAVRGTVALSPPCDLGPAAFRAAFGDDEAVRNGLSPVTLASRDAPPLLLLFGDKDANVEAAQLLQFRLLQAGQTHDTMAMTGVGGAEYFATAGTEHDAITAPVLAFLRRR